MLSLAMLVSIGLTRLVLPGLSALASQRRHGSRSVSSPGSDGAVSNLLSDRLLWAFGAYVIVHSIVSTSMAPNSNSLMRNLTHHDRASMEWVSTHTLPGSRFAVLTFWNNWEDPISEWFPVLANRQSLTTPQGYEWVGEFSTRVVNFAQLQKCAASTVACLHDWERKSGERLTHVYIRKWSDAPMRTCCPPLEYALRTSVEYEIVYDGPGTVILAKYVNKKLHGSCN
jgi:hypothetical protein